MKAWKNSSTGELYDIQTIPSSLPAGYDPEEWELVEVSEAELSALAKVASYTHGERGIKDLFVETPLTITLNLGELL